MNAVVDRPVVVVGAGPVGILAALELARSGLSPILLEAADGLAYSSRAICISRRSMEILDRAGAGPAVRAKALGWTRGQTFYRDTLVFRLEMPSSASDKHPPFVNLQQFHTERFLLDALEATGRADIRWGARLTGLEQRADHAVLRVCQAGQETAIEAAWVVAADGGRSACREALGLSLHGTSYEGRYLIADIEIASPRPVERQVWFDPPSNPGSTVILHLQPDNIWRLDFQIADGEDPDAALADDSLLARIGRHLAMMGETAPWALRWKSLYRAHCLTLDAYRHGSVLFAGDAAHLVPIFGVRGLNSGLDDAHNLGWKVAMVATGQAAPALLDSYTPERLKATRENIAQAAKSTWFMSPPTPGCTLLRDAVLSLSVQNGVYRDLINPRQSAPHCYDDSPLTTACAAGAGAGIVPGAPLPNLAFALRPGFLHAALAPCGFSLLVASDALPPGALAALQGWAAAADVALVSLASEAGIAGALAGAEWPVYLIRPDEHVAARFAQADVATGVAALDQALDRALGRAPSGGAAPHASAPTTDAPSWQEQVFAAMSAGVDSAGPVFLAQVALLLAAELADPAAVLRCVAGARGSAANPGGRTG